MMRRLQAFVIGRPRVAPALAFGGSTALLTHFAWYPSARMNGLAPALTLAAGLAHALAGVITGPRLIDAARTRTSGQALFVGAATSLLALVIFTPVMAAWVSAGGVSRPGALGFVAITLYTAFFVFLGAGWALLLLSAAVGMGLHRIAAGPV
jgi:hypothetical protein